MNKLLMSFLLVGLTTSALCMEKEAPKEEIKWDAFYAPEIRLHLTKLLHQMTSSSEFIHTFKAWCLTDKRGYQVFKDTPLLTTSLFKFLMEDFCYRNPDRNDFKQIKPLLQPEELLTIEKNTLRVDNLFKLFAPQPSVASSSEARDWSQLLAELKNLKEENLTDYIKITFGEDTFLTSPTRRAFLTQAIKGGAPQEIISLLLEYGCPVKQLHPTILPPFLAATAKFFRHQQDYEEKCSKEGAELKALKHEQELTTDHYHTLVDSLIKAGASLDECFYATNPSILGKQVSVLDLAALTGNYCTADYLMSKGARTLNNGGMLIAYSQFDGDPFSFKVLKELIDTCDEPNLFFISLLNCILSNDSRHELLILLRYLLDTKEVNINIIQRGATPLGMIKSLGDFKWRTELCDLLIEKGAIEQTNDLSRLIAQFETKNQEFLEAAVRGAVTPQLLESLLIEATQLISNDDFNLSAPGMIASPFITLFMLAFQNIQFANSGSANYIKATDGRFLVEYGTYGQLTSAFHTIIALLDQTRRYKDIQGFNKSYPFLLQRSCPLISWLVQQGLKDEALSKGKTAVQKAQELGFDDIAQHLAKELDAFKK